MSHLSLLNEASPVALSAIGAESQTFDGTGFVETSVPCGLKTAEIARLVEDYRQAAVNTKAAGFDRAEIHAANGYQIDQFLRVTSNNRTDGCGGSIANRARLLSEVVAAVTAVLGAGRVGVRLSPFSNANNVGIDSDTVATFGAAIDAQNDAGVAFLHLVEGQAGGPRDWPAGELEGLRDRFKGVYMTNNGYDRASAIAAVASGRADLVAFGKLYFFNPDLAERLARNAPLNPLPVAGPYGAGREGFTDYPTLAEVAA